MYCKQKRGARDVDNTTLTYSSVATLLAVLLSGCGGSNNTENAPDPIPDLREFWLVGEEQGDRFGFSVSAAGDVNGDGVDDVVFGAPGRDNSTGSSYILYGNEAGWQVGVNLSELNSDQGFRIDGSVPQGQFGFDVNMAGDVGQNGSDDLIIGAPFLVGDSSDSDNYGQGYVLSGKSEGNSGSWSAPTTVSQLNGDRGFSLVNDVKYDQGGPFGYVVSSVGDINHDGIDDVLISAPSTIFQSGSCFIVFGGSSEGLVSLQSLLDNVIGGFRLDGAQSPSGFGFSAATAGDMNNDGIDDMLIGAPGEANNLGAAYLVFGKSDWGYNPSYVNQFASGNGEHGVRILGEQSGDLFGSDVDYAGDVNGDNMSDVIIGAPGANSGLGVAYVLFGKDVSLLGAQFPAEIDIEGLLSFQGFRIEGVLADGGLGSAVSNAGDVNGDGLDDFIVGAPGANSGLGVAYVLFGYDTHKVGDQYYATVDLADLQIEQGFMIQGQTPDGSFGAAVTGLGDINADGFDDFSIGAPGSSGSTGSVSSGAAYVVLGRDDWSDTVENGEWLV